MESSARMNKFGERDRKRKKWGEQKTKDLSVRISMFKGKAGQMAEYRFTETVS